MSIIVNRKNERITGSIEGKPFNVLFNEENYKELKTLSTVLENCKSRETYASVVAQATGLLEVDYKSEVAAVNGFLKYLPNKGTYHLVINKGKKNEDIAKVAIPEQLADMIIESYEENNDYMPLILAWARFSSVHTSDAAVNYFGQYISAKFIDYDKAAKLEEEQGVVPEVARAMCTFQDIAITTFGLLATYKIVDEVKKIWKLVKDKDDKTIKVEVDAFPSTESIDAVTGEVTKTLGKPEYLEEITFTPAIWHNGHKFFCGDKLGYMYKIGQEAVLPEEAPRNTENTFGGGGLYCGGLRYIQGYSNPKTETLVCFTDPAEIISFQAEGSAIRANRLFPHNALMDGQLSGMYFISDYARESDIRLKARIKAAVAMNKGIKENASELDVQAKGLSDLITE